jgi:hypothetical protein
MSLKQTATRHLRLATIAGSVVVPIAISACGGGTTGKITAPTAVKRARWVALGHVRRPLDVVGPRSDGSIVLAAAGRLSLLTPRGRIQPFASGPDGYVSPGGEEPYIALSGNGCFGAGTVYALRLQSGRGVVAISSRGAARRFARLSAPGLIDGIAFDQTGDFGHRLVVTIDSGPTTTIDAIDCRGVVTTIARNAPRMEGGVAVAPRTFGRFAGDLIAPDEASGRIFAITPQGASLLVAHSGLPHGGDVGVESEGFVPSGSTAALVADRLTPGNPHPGDDEVLRLPAAALKTAGVRQGDLLVATEGGALTDAVSCTRTGCRVRFVADGPAVAHLEGHIAFR